LLFAKRLVIVSNNYYLDTSIWRDYFEDRKDNLRPLGEFAFRFLKECQKRKDIVFVSDIVKKELLKYFSIELVNEIFSSFKDIIVEIMHAEVHVSEAYSFWIRSNKKYPSSDILHSIIARDNKTLLVSRDKHFQEIGIVECKLPEEIY